MATKNIQAEIDAALEKYFEPPKKIARLIQQANHDLYSGPTPTGAGYPGFSEAVGRINDWIEKNLPWKVWYDVQSGEILKKEPQGEEDPDTGEWIEPFWDDFYEIDVKDIRRALLGRELASY